MSKIELSIAPRGADESKGLQGYVSQNSDRLSTASQAPVVTTFQQETQESPQQPSPIQTECVELETKKKAFPNIEERYRLLMEANSQLIWDTDADGQVITEQPGWSAFTGQTYDEYKGWGWLNAVHPDDQEQSKQAWADALAKRCLCTGEHRLRRHDGEYRYMSIRAVPVLETNGRIREWVGIHTDITETKQVQEALHKSEERYRSLVEAAAQIIWNTKPEGELVTEQLGWSNFTGQTYDEYKGWGWLNAIHPDDQQQTAQGWTDALANRTSSYEVEHRLRRYDGEYRHMYVRAVPVLEPDGRIREWVGVHTDITEKKQVQEARDRALAEAEAARAELHRVFMQAPAAISTSRGSNHIIETANPLYLQLIGNRDVIGKSSSEAFPELEAQGFVQLLDQVYTTGEPFIGNEMRAVFDRNGDGVQEESFWNFVYQPLVDAEGKVYGIMTHAVEVTEQVRARQEIEKKAEELAHLTQALKRSNQELDQFAYVTSHDLKAPLRAIANLSEWLEEDLADNINDDSREHLHLMRKRVHRMAALIDGILQYSRAGRLQQVEMVNVSTLLGDLIELLAPPPGISIVVEPGMPTLKTEKIPLEQVLINLMSNAIKYAQGTDTCIQVSVRDGGKYYEFAIQDNGPGIAPEFHNKIWGIFQRLEARDKVEGTGVGLSIVKKIVESRGGKVWLESELGAGATFCFTWLKQPQVSFD